MLSKKKSLRDYKGHSTEVIKIFKFTFIFLNTCDFGYKPTIIVPKYTTQLIFMIH